MNEDTLEASELEERMCEYDVEFGVQIVDTLCLGIMVVIVVL